MIVLATLLFLFSTAASAQFLRTSYFMEGTSYRLQLNPALAPGRGYINIPVLGSLNATVNSTSLGYQDVMDILENDDDNDFYMSDSFLNRLSSTNELNLNISTDIISAGWYKGKNFWSFNIGLRTDVGASVSRDLFEFMRDMDGLSTTDLTRLASIDETVGEQSLNLNMYTEIGLGLARDINSKLTVGGRIKALLGIGNAELNVNGMSVQSSTSGASIAVDADLELSSRLIEIDKATGGYINELEFGSFGLAGWGGAIDLGAAYRLTDRLTLSASILDLGFIKWSKGQTKVAKTNTDQSFDFSYTSDLQDFVDKVSSGEVLNYDMLELTVDESSEKSRTTGLTSTVVVGAEYELLSNWLVVGAVYTARMAEPKTLHELTFLGTIRPKNWFNLAVSYSVIQASGKTFGLAAKLGYLFLGTDYMFLGSNTKNVNAYIGISIPLNKKKKQSGSES